MPRPNVVELQDCFEFLSKLERNSIDLAIIDPPYNLRKADWDTFTSEQDFLNFTYGWIDAMLPVLKHSASFYIFNTPRHCAYIARYLDNKGLHFQNWITWDKRDGFTHTTKRFIPAQETILFYSKTKTPYFDADSVRQPYDSTERIAHAAKKGILKNGKRWFPNPKGKLVNDVWHIVSERHKSKVNGKIVKLDHLTPKPLEMIERMVLASSRSGDLVMDCFAGSGTTAIASMKHGRQFIGCDNDPEYVQFANKRIKTWTSQTSALAMPPSNT